MRVVRVSEQMHLIIDMVTRRLASLDANSLQNMALSLGRKANEHSFCLFFLGEANVDFSIDSAWTNQGRIESIMVVRRCK